RWTPRAAPVRNSRHRGHPAPRRADYNVVIRSGSEAVQPAAARTLTAMGRALVLNATELPLAVVPARRAVVLVLKEKAEVVQSNGAIFHSERIALEAPSVVRLRHFVHVPFRAHAALARRSPRVGERGRGVPAMQRQEDGPNAARGRFPSASPTLRPVGRLPPDP